MASFGWFVPLLALACVQLTASQTPVLARPPGFVYQQSSSTPKVVVEAFYDHLCPDSRDNWPILKSVLQKFANQDVNGIIHIFPLPYHHNAYFMQQAGVVVRQVDPTKFIQYMELVFDNLSLFTTSAENMTEPQVKNTIVNFIYSHIGVAKEKVQAGFTDQTVTNDSRYAWKYACSRAITGTAQFVINGVHVPDAPGYSEQQWVDFINQLLSTPV